MKTIKLLVLSVALSVSAFTSQAITNTMIAVSGTNLMLSWPSYGYETYLIQYRHTLDSTDSWSTLTNDFLANSTNLSTLPIVPELAIDNGTNDESGGGDGGGGPMPPGATNGVAGDSYTPGTGFYRIFHIPDWLVTFSGYAFDGPTFIPVDFSAPDADTNYVDDVTVLMNGQPTDDAIYTSDDIDGTIYWGMGIYFDRFPNGTNTIQLLTTVRQSDTLNDQTPYMVFSNAPQTITISNFVTYTNWSDLILSNTYTFNAQSAVTDVDWEIDIYDVNGYFVNSQTGHSDDGNISWTWDLTDDTGASRLDDNDPFFYPYISITDDSGDPGGWTPSLANQFPSKGSWLFAYMDNFYDDGTSNYAGADFYYTNAIHTMEGGAEEWIIPVYDYPIKYGRNYTQAQRDSSWAMLKANYLQSWSIRNFYYFGHGAADVIGGDINTLDSSNNITGSNHFPGSNAYLDDLWVLGNVLVNKPYGSIPFRFVFLDGCDTAAGYWPIDWGVPKQTVNEDYYRSSANKTGARPNAFVGWDVTIGGNKGWGTISSFWEFRKDWMAEWAGSFEEPLDDSFDKANLVSSWVDAEHYSHLKKFGYTTMMFQQYNQAGDWP